MFTIWYRRLLKLPRSARLFDYPQNALPQNVVLFELFFSRAITNEEADKQQSFTVAYLEHKCGLSFEDAIIASKKVKLESPKQPDRVLFMLKNNGFTKSNICRMVRKRPDILKADPEKSILPKLKFFRSIGVPATKLAGVASCYPDLLRLSLEKNIIPSYNYLKSFVHTDKKVVYIFKRSARVFLHGSRKEIPSNIAILRKHRVPESYISFLLAYHPTSLLISSDTFLKYVNRAILMGFDSSKLTFLLAIQVFSGLSQSTFDRKGEIYKRWGWSDSDVTLAFSVHPICMNLSEQKIMSTMDFLVNKVGCKSTAIAKCPLLLFFNLEKRIMPRCQVAKVLILKGLIKKTTHVSSLVLVSTEKFIQRYVTRYLEDIPQLLDLYQGKVGVIELGFLPDEVSKVKLL